MTSFSLSFSPTYLIPKRLQSPALAGSILEEIYPIARASILKQYEAASKVTPYAASMLGRKKRSGKRITSVSPPVPPFGIDTGAFRSGLERLKKIDAATLFVYSDVFYSEFLLAKFEQKSPIGGLGIQQDALAIIETKIFTTIAKIWTEELS